ncbi:MAG: F0F1 ATP synthase subunit A [Actinomyces sp.]|uniref:F0F1 ATP synthase subunit A n=1 Tax=uncultured Actinomyces sp. TaxID=249061 RepID=UPI0028060A3C|nr:F0F1 ATP synthase subunit A [uncultured Actinomyces sp.]MDU4831781.1 F0F1 ATP synthase subunit A [Actinomyces sp.]
MASQGPVSAMPGIGDFFPPAFAFEGTIFEMNRLVLVRLIATVLLVLVFSIGASRAKLIPTKGQSILEGLIVFIRDKVAIETLGEKNGRKYAPILTVIFLGVLFMNITGVIPGLNIAASSVVAVPLGFALISYVVFVGAGIKHLGAGQFFKNQLFPPGVPWPLYILLTPIEFLSTFIIRPATLTIRLLANMLAGHLMLALTFFGTHFLFFEAAGALKGVAVLTFASAIGITAFEIFVAGLQAFIFSILTAVYIKTSIETH